jgi:hypothetical protein
VHVEIPNKNAEFKENGHLLERRLRFVEDRTIKG